MVTEDAESFVVLLAQSGTQEVASAVLGVSRPAVSRRLKVAREVLGDARVLELIEAHKRDDAAGITLRKSFVMESKCCGVCGTAKILQPTGRWRCNACRNARYRDAHPLPAVERVRTAEEAATEFVVLLSQAGTQAAAAKLLVRSQAVVSERLTKARAVLGDERVKELLLANLRDEKYRAGLLKPFTMNRPVCAKCGGIRTALPSSGALVCRACANIRNEAYKAKHAGRVAAAAAAYRDQNREALVQKRRDYYAANPEMNRDYYRANSERIKASVKAYRELHKDEIAAYHQQYYQDAGNRKARNARLRAWKKLNPHKVNADTARRQLRLRQAYVAWADDDLITQVYELARLRTELTGIPWEVDHIVPLNSDLVCGLHCEANLQVIPAETNLAKGNRWWPDMPGDAELLPFAAAPALYLEVSALAAVIESLEAA